MEGRRVPDPRRLVGLVRRDGAARAVLDGISHLHGELGYPELRDSTPAALRLRSEDAELVSLGSARMSHSMSSSRARTSVAPRPSSSAYRR